MLNYSERFNRWFDKRKGKKKNLKEHFYSIYKSIKGDYYTDEKLAFLLLDYSIKTSPETVIKTLQKVIGVKMNGIIDVRTIITTNVQPRVYQRFKDIFNAVVY